MIIFAPVIKYVWPKNIQSSSSSSTRVFNYQTAVCSCKYESEHLFLFPSLIEDIYILCSKSLVIPLCFGYSTDNGSDWACDAL